MKVEALERGAPRLYATLRSNMKEAVIMNSLRIGYKTHKGTRIVAEGITAAIRQGELTCLLGENGVGKSTLLRTLAGFMPPLGGSISMDGKSLDELTPRQLARTVGVVLTERLDVQQLRVDELVAMGRSPYTGFWGRLDDTDRQAVDEAIRQVGICDLRQRLVSTLSDGERQKAMIAKALAQQTPIIYLDEPTAFLDYPSKAEMLLLLRRICRETQKTVFLSTHDLELALQVADTVWLMEQGGTLHIGTPRQLADEGMLGRFIERDGMTFDAQTLSVNVKTTN